MTTVIYNALMRHVATRLGLKQFAQAAGILMLAGAAVLQAGCSSNEPDAKAALQVVEDVSGWFDAGIVNGQNKLVPEVAFRAKNVADRPISNVSFNVVFKVVNDTQELGSAYLQGIDSKGLPPGQTSAEFVGRSQLGYTSQEPRVQMLQHSQFKDVEVEIFAKHGPANWVSLGKFTVKRQLITQ
jgi:hypothetical protein